MYIYPKALREDLLFAQCWELRSARSQNLAPVHFPFVDYPLISGANTFFTPVRIPTRQTTIGRMTLHCPYRYKSTKIEGRDIAC